MPMCGLITWVKKKMTAFIASDIFGGFRNISWIPYNTLKERNQKIVIPSTNTRHHINVSVEGESSAISFDIIRLVLSYFGGNPHSKTGEQTPTWHARCVKGILLLASISCSASDLANCHQKKKKGNNNAPACTHPTPSHRTDDRPCTPDQRHQNP